MKTVLFLCTLFTLNILQICKIKGDSSNIGSLKECDSYTDSTLNKRVYYNLEDPPSYIGGQGKFLSFISNNLKINREDYNFSKIPIYIIIDEKGHVLKLLFRKEIPEDLKSKLKVLIEDTSTWLPGKCNGKEVLSRVETTIGW